MTICCCYCITFLIQYLFQFYSSTRNPTVIWEELHHHPSRQKCTCPLCVLAVQMPTADESSHSAATTSTSQRCILPIRYITLPNSILPSLKKLLLPTGILTSTGKKSSLGQSNPPPQMASWSSLPTFHNTLDRQTDRNHHSIYQHPCSYVSYTQQNG